MNCSSKCLNKTAFLFLQWLVINGPARRAGRTWVTCLQWNLHFRWPLSLCYQSCLIKVSCQSIIQSVWRTVKLFINRSTEHSFSLSASKKNKWGNQSINTPWPFKRTKKQQQQGKNKNWIFFIHQQYGTWYLGRLWRDSTSSTTYLVPSRGCDRDPVGARWENGVSLADPLKPMGGSGEALLDAPAHDTIKVPEVA